MDYALLCESPWNCNEVEGNVISYQECTLQLGTACNSSCMCKQILPAKEKQFTLVDEVCLLEEVFWPVNKFFLKNTIKPLIRTRQPTMTVRRDWFTTPLALYYAVVMANIVVFTRTQTFNLQPSHSKNVAHFHLNSDMMKSMLFIKCYTFWKTCMF